jgi:hypothetical protein
MDIAWPKIVPVLVSIGIIILVAVLREYSKTFAAIAATMPINVPLALWIVSAGSDRTAMTQFTEALFINIWPSMIFLVIAVLAARAGWGVVPMIAAGYVGWALGLGAIFLLRQMFGG